MCLDKNSHVLSPFKTWQDRISRYIMPYMLDSLSQYRYSSAVAGKKLSEINEASETALLEGTHRLPDGRASAEADVPTRRQGDQKRAR